MEPSVSSPKSRKIANPIASSHVDGMLAHEPAAERGARPFSAEGATSEGTSGAIDLQPPGARTADPLGDDPRRARILAKTIFRELTTSGLQRSDVIGVATELLGLVADDLKAGPSSAR